MDRTLKGRRVRLIYTTDNYTKLEAGALGTVNFEDDMETLHVKWDDGSSLGLIAGEDAWEILSPVTAS